MSETRVLNGGIKELKWGKECTFIGALEAALKHLGEDTDYTELMGMSGAAFRIQFNCEEWSTTSVDMFSKNEAADFLGYYLEKYRVLDKDGNVSTPKEEVLDIIKSEISSGRPVIGINLLHAPDWGLIVGFDGNDLLVRDYHEKEDMERIEGYVKARRFPNIIFTLRKNDIVPDRIDSIKKSLGYSVRKFKLKKLFKYYSNGFTAYDYWASGLADEEFFTESDSKTFYDHWLVNGLMYSNLYDARHSAHVFLKRASNLIEDDLDITAEYYSDLEQIIWDNWVHFPLPFHLKRGSRRIAIPGGRYIEGNTWSPEMRKQGYKALKLIKKMEYRAMAQLEKSVKKWDEKPEFPLGRQEYSIKKSII